MSHDLIFQILIKTKAEQTMSNGNANGTVTVLGIDLAKQNFQLHGVDGNGQAVLKLFFLKKFAFLFQASYPRFPMFDSRNRHHKYDC